MKTIPKSDTKFQEYTIKSAEPSGEDGYTLSFEEGTCIFMPKTDIVPEKGQKVLLYGKGFGCRVRGMVVNDQVVYYRTPEEDKEQVQKEVEKTEAKRKKEYLDNLSEYDKRVSKLPPIFQERIIAFRKYQPNKWCFDFEPYELFVCEQAVLLANHLKTTENIQTFVKKDWKEQREEVPELSEDHSGNTFGMACHLAVTFLSMPEFIPRMHGALCPLVGCKDYGCYSVRTQTTNQSDAAKTG